ncbi:MAG: hypothetical protein IPI07_03030, partial [Flavobacteriales bacterium]|nr:hypothetical protein [Flavobacteriales bacterium]
MSGCHDGTFEPEFRTIASAYNSLVYHPVIANDARRASPTAYCREHDFLPARKAHHVFVANTSGVMRWM